MLPQQENVQSIAVWRQGEVVIYGLTHNEDGEALQRLAVAFKVSIGIPAKDGKNYPSKADHFFIRSKDAAGEWADDTEFMKHLQEIYCPAGDGGRRAPLREFDIVFLSDKLDDVFRTELAWWSSSERKCFGDGLKAMRSITTVDKDTAREHPGERYVEWEPCGEKCPDLKERRCKPNGQLFFIFKDRPVMGNVASYTTTSYETVRRLHSSLLQIHQITGGRLRGIPLKIVMRPGPTRYQQDGKMKKGMAYFVNIEFRQNDWAKMIPELIKSSVQYDKVLLAGPKMLETVEEEPIIDAEEAHAMAAEFYPENRTETVAASTAVQESLSGLQQEIKAVTDQLGAPPAQVEALHGAMKGDLDATLNWLKAFSEWNTKLNHDKAKTLECFARGVVNPDGALESFKNPTPPAEKKPARKKADVPKNAPAAFQTEAATAAVHAPAPSAPVNNNPPPPNGGATEAVATGWDF